MVGWIDREGGQERMGDQGRKMEQDEGKKSEKRRKDMKKTQVLLSLLQ
jgi:hypothetical protein